MYNNSQNWYASWFDTDYYHILYKDRHYEEAQLFIDNITHYLNLPENAKVLDLACGRGRHSIYLNKLGYDVLGTDLSANSIRFAKQFENETLHFAQHDMAVPCQQKFDVVFNLFTSFGYFDDDDKNLETLIAIKESLTEYGFAVLDFMNVEKVIQNLVEEETKEVDGITFYIKRKYENGHIFKNIRFTDKGQNFEFTERVKALTLEDFEALLEKAGMYLLETFGDYKLNRFYKNSSDRLILLFK